MANNEAINESVGQVVQQLKFRIAMEDPIQHIKELIPLLELRHRLAADYFKQSYFIDATTTRNEVTEKQYTELIGTVNKQIISLLGL